MFGALGPGALGGEHLGGQIAALQAGGALVVGGAAQAGVDFARYARAAWRDMPWWRDAGPAAERARHIFEQGRQVVEHIPDPNWQVMNFVNQGAGILGPHRGSGRNTNSAILESIVTGLGTHKGMSARDKYQDEAETFTKATEGIFTKPEPPAKRPPKPYSGDLPASVGAFALTTGLLDPAIADPHVSVKERTSVSDKLHFWDKGSMITDIIVGYPMKLVQLDEITRGLSVKQRLGNKWRDLGCKVNIQLVNGPTSLCYSDYFNPYNIILFWTTTGGAGGGSIPVESDLLLSPGQPFSPYSKEKQSQIVVLKEWKGALVGNATTVQPTAVAVIDDYVIFPPDCISVQTTEAPWADGGEWAGRVGGALWIAYCGVNNWGVPNDCFAIRSWIRIDFVNIE